MRSIMEYDDYRAFMRDYYAEHKLLHKFSWREFAKRAGFSSPTYLKMVCDAKTSLSEPGIRKVAEALRLDFAESDYFRALVHYNQAGDSDERAKSEKEMRRIFRTYQVNIIGQQQYSYFSSILNSIVRELAEAMPGKTPMDMMSKFIRMPALSDIKESLETLESTHLLDKNGEHSYMQKSKLVSTGALPNGSIAVHRIHAAWAEMARDFLDVIPKEERDFSGITMGIAERTFPKVVQELADCRKRIMALIQGDEGIERVYRLNIQMFPVTRAIKKTPVQEKSAVKKKSEIQ